MKIRVVKASDAFYWYASKIGQEFEVEYLTKDSGVAYCWVRSGDSYNTINFIKADDCDEIITKE